MSTANTAQMYADVVQDIQEFYVESCRSVHVPTLGKDYKFKPLSVEQLKKFIELQVGTEKDEIGVLPSLKTVDQINQVITDNCIDGGPNLTQQLTIFDRDAIIAQLRAYTNSNIEVAGEDNGV